MSTLQITISRRKTAIIRGLAILAVLSVHILSSLHQIYLNQTWQWFSVSLDQASRFCVPAFIILSGYGLASKYHEQQVSWWPFIKSRLKKLLPLYIVWSATSALIFSLVPTWSAGYDPQPFLLQLLFGRADYQMYFLVVLFQLYVIFPWLWRGQRHITAIFFGSLGVQLATFFVLAKNPHITDQQAYVFAGSWIAYFSFGLFLRLHSLPKFLCKLAPTAALLCLGYLISTGIIQIQHGLDPLFALEFTRLPVMLFAFLLVLSFVTYEVKLHLPWLTKANNFLAWLGKNSYLLFLIHTMALRIIKAAITQELPWLLWGEVFLLWTTGFLVAILLERGKITLNFQRILK